MIKRNIVKGQRVLPAKAERARELRRTMTPEEQILWQHLRNHQLGGLGFRRQQVIDGFIADFYCSTAGLVVEVDGGIHTSQQEYDTERDALIAGRGLRILRVTNDNVRWDLAGVLARIKAYASL